MALAAINVTIGSALSGGEYNSVVKSRKLPLYDLTTTKADITTALADITTALGAAGGSHDSTPEITTVQTDVTAVQTAVNALALAIDADVTIVINTTNITTRSQLRYAIRKALQGIEGSDLLTP